MDVSSQRAPGLGSFVRHLFVFAAIACSIAFALRGVARVMVIRTMDLQDQALDERIDEIDTLIMGDSHAQDLDYRLTPRTFHIASPSESVIESYYRLRHITDRKPKRLERVVLSVGLHSFLETKQVRQNASYWARRIDYLELAAQEDHPLPVIAEAVRGQLAFVGEGLGIWRGLWGSYRHWLKGTSPPTWQTRLQRWDRPTPDLAGLDEAAIAILVRKSVAGHVVHGAAFDPVVARYFERILDLCRDAGLRILVVDMPVLDAYLVEIAKHVDVAAHDRFVARSVARTGADFLDLRSALTDRSYFSDPEHVSLKGRGEVTRRVREHLAASHPAATTGSAPPAVD
jgi:hypothetical protein